MERIEELEKQNYDISEDALPEEVKVNPDYYIHHALLKAQNCFLKDDAETGFSQYLMIIDHIEAICRAAGSIGAEYEQKIKEYMASPAYREFEGKQLIRLVKLATRKLEYILIEIFGSRSFRGVLEESKFLKDKNPNKKD